MIARIAKDRVFITIEQSGSSFKNHRTGKKKPMNGFQVSPKIVITSPILGTMIAARYHIAINITVTVTFWTSVIMVSP